MIPRARSGGRCSPPPPADVPGPKAGARLTDAEAGLLQDNVRALLDSDHPSEAISLLEDGIERAGHDPALQLQLRHLLGAALFYAGEYTRAAAVLDAAGGDYRRYFPPNDPVVLDCAYHAGHAYAETGKPGKALPQLRFYVQNADTSAGEDEARKVLETRFVIAQLLAADGYPDEALAELQAVRPLLADTFGPDSTQVRNLDKQAARLRTPSVTAAVRLWHPSAASAASPTSNRIALTTLRPGDRGAPTPARSGFAS